MSTVVLLLGKHFQDHFGNLRILDPMKEDAGVYQCRVINPVATVTHDITLIVNSKSITLYFCDVQDSGKDGLIPL